MIFIRSTLFNVLFYGVTAMACILCLPALLLPRDKIFIVVHGFVGTTRILEKYVLGLTYEVRGLENLPKDGAFVVAAKHQSAYETLKLHILFKKPAVVLKQELIRIPLWGRFLDASGPIAIDRSKGKQASAQLVDGARRVKKEGRPIIIFPQGTRVYPWQTPSDKPYKGGVVRIYDEAEMPIVPLALNTGLFWPRNSWIKKPGKVIFEFLPAIEPGKDPQEVLKQLEQTLESSTHKLEQEALSENKYLLPPAEMKAQHEK